MDGGRSRTKDGGSVWFSRVRRVVGLAPLVLFGLVVGFGLAELGARLYLSSTESPSRSGVPGPLEADPEAGQVVTAENIAFSATYVMVHRRFRRPCPNHMDSSAPGYRLAVLGDSFAFGSGVEECETFSALLTSERPWIHVSNFGMSGAGFHDALGVVDEWICGGDYDGVLFLAHGNDFLVPDPSDRSHRSAFVGLMAQSVESWMVPHRARPDDIQGVNPDLLGLGEKGTKDLYYYPILADLLRDRDVFVHLSEPPADFRADNLEVFDNLLQRMRNCADDVWVAVVPNGASVDDRQRRYVEEHHGTVPGTRASGWVYKTIRDRTRETGGVFMETFDDFLHSRHRNYYEADVHWTAAGHRLFAGLLLDVLPTQTPQSR